MKYIPDPQTIAEAIKREEIFEVYPDEVEVLQGFKGVVTRIINKDKHLGDYATIHFCKTAQFFEHSELNFNPRTNDKLIIILKERVRPFASCYWFAKNHPIRSLFQRYLRMVFESGIWRKIYDHKRHIFRGYRYRVLLRILIPFFYIEHGQLKGFDKQLLTIISEAHHATVEILWRRVKLRLIVLAFLILKFALTESYLVKVIQFLTDMKYEADPQTIAEVIERKEVFAVYPEEVEILEEFNNVILKIVHKLKQYFINDYATIHFCKTAHFFEHSDQNFNPQTNDKLIIILKERVRPFASCYGFAKNHPIRSLFERYMRRVFESGIWRRIYDHHTTAEGRFWMLLRPNEYPIDFKDLSPLWVVLGIGLAVSLACFLVEMFRNR
ncbi:conserved hypothetical protein [Culex quinquefasciatus]|uniref:Uncharacterized protein n=1 Tax=Culex quinquefasciatus TaxID=7176 RepID=B0XHS4_CULQU|nr:conserved hypothetical protein [Culex quinquefasciatus]|eukprot:XP_001869196.1 conserved hypothetical protein [Culex quinquefasciatus]